MQPTTTQWSSMPITFGNYAARHPSVEDIKSACNLSTTGTTGELNNCVFVFENTKFSNASTGKTAYWLSMYESGYYRVMSTTRAVATGITASSKNGVRPVIEVPLNQLES